MKIMLLYGSYHDHSYTQAVLRSVAGLLHEHQILIPRIHELPLYCGGPIDSHIPDRVVHFLEQVGQADALVICTPEYNHSIPALLKNAIDWASRPAFQSGLKDKPVTFITQAQSPVGGARAQAHLRLVFDSTLSRIHMAPEMLIAGVDQKFDAQGELVDARTRERLVRHLDDFVRFAARVGVAA